MTDSRDLEQMVMKYENALYRTALALLRDGGEAEDAVQDTFLRYLEKAPAFEDENHEKAWLLRVTINSCKSRLRKRKRYSAEPLPENIPAPQPREEGVMEAMGALPWKERSALHLFYIEGFGSREIAAAMGEPEGTVRSRLSRARKKLREQLKGEAYE